MLETLNIKNFAIIENTSLSFNLGFNVLIGQTGAGKSIVINSLKFVLGDKPNKDNIRTGENEMYVKAVFSNLSQKVNDCLNSFDIACDDVLIISRSFNIEGKSSCKINGETVTVSMLKQIGSLLVDICGQHDGTMLLNSNNHLTLLDSYAKDTLLKDKEKLSELLSKKKEIEKEILSLGGDDTDRERTLDLLDYQIKEIENANLKEGEDEQLENDIQVMSNHEKISNALEITYSGLSNDNLYQALSNLEFAGNYDNKLLEYAERLKSVFIEFEDISSSINEYMSNMSFSENELDNLTLRLESIKSLKKKYGNTIEDVLNYLDECKTKYENIQNSEELLLKLQSQKVDIIKELYNVCVKIHNTRIKVAKEIETKVEKELATLGMKNTKFTIMFNQLPDIENAQFTTSGFDTIEFMFSANAGEQQRSLVKTISGGELSRFMLAIKNVFASCEDTNLLIFDEIDSGVSGEVGYLVGQKLAILSKTYQIICITHLPQVTALADNYIYISKQVEGEHTKSVASYLTTEQLASYLVTLFGSKESTAGLEHAKELITSAQKFKENLNK